MSNKTPVGWPENYIYSTAAGGETIDFADWIGSLWPPNSKGLSYMI